MENEKKNKYEREYRRKNLKKIRKYQREYHRKWDQENRKKIMKHKIKNKNRTEYNKEYTKDYRKRKEIKEKYILRQIAYHNLRKTLIDKIGKCQICGDNEKLELHHKNYNSNKKENITLLCRNCHRQLHRKN